MKFKTILTVLAVGLMGLLLLGCGSDAGDNAKDNRAKAASVDTSENTAAGKTTSKKLLSRQGRNLQEV